MITSREKNNSRKYTMTTGNDDVTNHLYDYNRKIITKSISPVAISNPIIAGFLVFVESYFDTMFKTVKTMENMHNYAKDKIKI